MHIGVAIVATSQWDTSVKYKENEQKCLSMALRDMEYEWQLTIYFSLHSKVGLRRRTYTVLSGSVLAVWQRVENQLVARGGPNNNKMQVIRLKTTEGGKIVGILIAKNCVDSLIADLSVDAEKVDEQTFGIK